MNPDEKELRDLLKYLKTPEATPEMRSQWLRAVEQQQKVVPITRVTAQRSIVFAFLKLAAVFTLGVWLGLFLNKSENSEERLATSSQDDATILYVVANP